MKTQILIPIDYHPERSTPKSIQDVLAGLIETSLGTPGVLDECGNPKIGSCEIQDPTTLEQALKLLARFRKIVTDIGGTDTLHPEEIDGEENVHYWPDMGRLGDEIDSFMETRSPSQ